MVYEHWVLSVRELDYFVRLQAVPSVHIDEEFVGMVFEGDDFPSVHMIS